ncbi:hypothetical protein [Longimicrobium sp.]|jgi:hypothetical protein|uniref:hypothetical protein n=1 Tax=Longimicrobium sp. TaxID=2029185 RepID=UPI002EDB57DE
MDPQLALHLDTTRPALSWDQLDPDEAAVARVLQWGRANALQVPEIASAAGLPRRRTQEVIRRLVCDHAWPVGTSMTEPHGNYLIDSADELEATYNLLRGRGLEHLQRAAALKRMSLQDMIRAVQTEICSLN